MPYIESELRTKYDKVLNQMPTIDNKGDLEYCVMKLFRKYMIDKEFRYSILHAAIYGIIHVGDECRRRFLDKREDEAREANGDVS